MSTENEIQPADEIVDEQCVARRNTLRMAILGALAATGVLMRPSTANAQQRTTLASLQADLNAVVQGLAAFDAQLGTVESELASVNQSLGSVFDIVDSILAGGQSVGSVDGKVRIADSSVVASVQNAGELRFSQGQIQFSDGTQWRKLQNSSIFVQYGNVTPPQGFTQIETGAVYSSEYRDVGSVKSPILLPFPTAGQAVGSNGANIYPVVTGEAVLGIPNQRAINGVACVAPRPTRVFWGTTSAPTGWTKIYSGVGMAALQVHNGGPFEPLLVNNEVFQGDVSSVNGSSLIYGFRTLIGGTRRLVQGVLAMIDE